MLNNINSRGLSKFKKVEVLNYPGATSSDIIDKIDYTLDKPELLIVHISTNNLATSHMNLLSNIKKIVTETKKK